MKKLLVALLILAFAAGGVFAQTVNFGGWANSVVDVARGSTSWDDELIWAGGSQISARIQADAVTADGTFGGSVRLGSRVWNDRFSVEIGGVPESFGVPGGIVQGWTWVWWQPLDVFRIQLNNNPDGHYGAEGITGWGFHALPNELGISVENYFFVSTAQFGAAPFVDGGLFNRSQAGALLSVFPVPGLDIHIGVPFIGMALNSDPIADRSAEIVYKNTNAQVSYSLDGIGRFALSFVGTHKDVNDMSLSPRLFGYFGLTMIENLSLDFGLGYTLPWKVDADKSTIDIQEQYNAPFAIGLGAKFDAGIVGINARAMGLFGGKYRVGDNKDNDVKDPVTFAIDVLPYFNISDNFTAFLGGGITVSTPDNPNEVDNWKSAVWWNVNPYVAINSGGATFYAGIRVWADGGGSYGLGGDPDLRVMGTAFPPTYDTRNNKIVNWSVPVGINFYF